MRARRLISGLLVPALLVGLVLLLATLQYRWLGQVSQAEREQLQRSLTQRARDFADEFDREISQAYTALRMTGDVLATGAWAPWSEAFERWRAAAKFPGIVNGVYLA
jgi:CHASE1-domain containing sensor protein